MSGVAGSSAAAKIPDRVKAISNAGSLTVGEYLQRWLKDSVKGTVRHSTYEVHRHMIEPYIIPALGYLKLKDLSPVHVRSLYREKLDSGLSAATVRKIHSVLRKALKQAVMVRGLFCFSVFCR